MSTHRERQDAARAKKAAEKHAREEAIRLAAFRRACVRVTVPKDDLLRLLREASFVSADATRIVATGHLPDELIVTYTKELQGDIHA